MDLGGVDRAGDPDDADHGHGHDEDDDFAPRGWIPPEDRLWRHPSEMGASAGGESLRSVATHRRPTSQERRAVLTLGVAGAAAVTALVATLTLFNGTSGAPVAGRVVSATSATDTSLVGPNTVSSTTRAPSTTGTVVLGASVVDAVSRVRPSLVAVVSPSSGRAMGTGVVIGDGSLVLTSASVVAGAKRFDAVTASGKRLKARLLGTDPHAGIAVLAVHEVGTPLAPAAFADEAVQPGEPTIATCLCTADPPTTSGPTPQVALSTVRVTEGAVDVDARSALVDAIEADAPLSPDPAGGLLLDAQGRIIGILDGVTADGDGGLGVFVPAPLAMGVAEELAAGRQVTHGWLGLSATDVTGGCGARVVSVMPDLPAAMAGVVAGDVVDEVDGHQVCSLAELQARLYVAPPGGLVQLHLETPAGGRTLAMALTPAA
jgi:S1-C subfamily serine protease